MALRFPLPAEHHRPLQSDLVENQFPEFYHDEAPNFMLFIKAYYEYMEQEGKLQKELNNVEGYKDIDLTLDAYIEYFRKTVLPSIPRDVLADKRLLVKTIRDFYQSKGTIDSYRFLFRILYDEDIEVNYPADQMLKVSDSDFRLDRYLVISADERAFEFVGKTIKGIESLAEGFVEGVIRRGVNGRDIMQILVSRVAGTFKQDENIREKALSQGQGFEPQIEVGISTITVKAKGAQYAPGDVVDLISSQTGADGKGVVTAIENQAGIIVFDIEDGGSGYAASTESPGTIISIAGGDGTSLASFIISTSDITDTFAISRCITLLTSNTVYGNSAPLVANSTGGLQKMGDFANTFLCAPAFGFPEAGQTVTTGSDYRTNSNAVLVIANTSDPTITTTKSLFGVTSSANGKVTAIRRAYNSTDIVLAVDTYKNFSTSEKVNINTASGTTVGTVSAFYANTISTHEVVVGNVNSQTISVGDELVGLTARFGAGNTSIIGDVGGGGASSKSVHTFAVVKSIESNAPNSYLHNGTANNTSVSGTVSSSGNTVTGTSTTFTSDFEVGDEIKAGGQAGQRIFSITNDTELVTAGQFSPALSGASYGVGGNWRNRLTLQVSANNTANLTSQFDGGPLLGFIENEGIRKVGSSTVVANSAAGSSNAVYENVYTKLQDSILFEAGTFGTIGDLSLEVGGANYTVAPTVTVTNPTIASLGIRDVFLRLQNTASNWSTGNSQITTFDTNDRIVQSSTGAAGDIKQIPTSSPEQFGGQLTTVVAANGLVQTWVRVFQDELQATNNIQYANNALVTVNFYTSADQTTEENGSPGEAKIVEIRDNGILGQNATINTTVGADGAITRIRAIDSGFAYKPGETVTFSSSGRAGASSGTGELTLSGVANAEGFYTSSKGHISSKRAFIQDSERYQEFSYELSSGIAFNKYKDFVDTLVHPGGMKLFGQFRNQAINNMDMTSTIVRKKRLKAAGTVTIKMSDSKASNTIAVTNGSFNVTGTLFGSGRIHTATNTEVQYLSVNKFSRDGNNVIVQSKASSVASNTSNEFFIMKLNANTNASGTGANLESKYQGATSSAANVYFANTYVISGSGTSLTTNFANGDNMIVEYLNNKFVKLKLNKVTDATTANLASLWIGSPSGNTDTLSANIYYETDA